MSAPTRAIVASLLLTGCAWAPVSDCVREQLESSVTTRYAYSERGPANAEALVLMIPEQDRAIGDEPVLWFQGADGSWRYFRADRAVFYDFEVRDGA